MVQLLQRKRMDTSTEEQLNLLKDAYTYTGTGLTWQVFGHTRTLHWQNK
jgi:hypothetical protein